MSMHPGDSSAHQAFMDEIRSMSEADLIQNMERLETIYDVSFDALINPARADWAMLGTFYDKTVLVVSNDASALSLTLAPRAKHVTHAALDAASVAFVTEIARMRGLTNLTTRHTELHELANDPGTYDRIILAGTLAQSSNQPDGGSPGEQQVALLANLREMLNADGEVWIATENRLAPKHFAGQVSGDDLPFSPLAPPRVREFATKITGRGKVSRHLTTENELRTMLGSAGYSDHHVFYAVTDYERPRFISSTTNDNVIGTYLGNVRQGAHLKAKVAMGLLTAVDRLGQAGRFSPYLIVRATR